MPAKARRYISPSTGDYVVDSGGLKADTGIASKVVLALRTRRGSMAVLPTFGSRLHEIRKADTAGVRQAEFYAAQALAHLAGEVTEMNVAAALSTERKGAIEVVVAWKLGDVADRVSYTATVGG